MRFILCLCCCLILLKGIAQEKEQPKYIEDKYSYYFGLISSNAMGSYRTVLKEGNKAGPKFGISGGVLFNPYKRKRASTVFYGADFGLQGDGAYNVVGNTIYDYRVRNTSYWLNGLVRYRPILWSSNFNPYADAFFGGKVIQSTVWEQINEEQSETYQRWTKVTPNYGLGVGVGIKLFGSLKNSYLDIGLYYQQAEAVKIVRPNSVYNTGLLNFEGKQVLSTTNQLILKMTITGFN